MKRAGLIALSMLLLISLPAVAAANHYPYSRKARPHAKAPKPRASAPAPAKPTLAKKSDSDPTQSWQAYSYP